MQQHYLASGVAQALAAGGHLVAVRADALEPEALAKAFDDFGSEFEGWKEAQAKLIEDLQAASEGSEKDQAKAAAELEAQAKLIEGLEAHLKEIEQRVHEGVRSVETVKPKTMGDFVIQSEAFKALALKPGQVPSSDFKLRVEANTLIGQTSGGDSDNTLVDEQRRPGIIPGAFRALRVVDLLTTIPVSSNAWEFTRENTWTSNAAETAEAAAKPESDLTFELLTVPIRTIAHWIKASNQILADAPALRAYIDRRLRHGVDNREDLQLIQGNGTGQNISGMTDAGNHTPFVPASGATDAIDNLNVAKYQIIAADYAPNGIIMNPADWGAIERQKDGQGQYLVGNPFGSITPVMWGLPVVATNNMLAANFIMGAMDLAYDHLLRSSTVVEIGFVNDDFSKNLVTIRGEKRAALASNVPAATRYGPLSA